MTDARATSRCGARASSVAVLVAFVAFAIAPVLAGAAEHARVKLDYRVTNGAIGCPSRDELVDAVAARMGYDPFAPTSDTSAVSVVVDVTFARGVFTGELRYGGSRAIESPSCRELVDSLAVAIALSVDPESVLRPQPSGSASASIAPPPPASIAPPPPASIAPPPPASIAPPPPASIAPPPLPSSAEERPEPVALWMLAFGALGDTPSATAGLAIAANFPVRRLLSINAELSATLPSSVRIGTGDRGQASASVDQLLVGACVPIRAASLCATASGGALYATSSEVDASKPTLAAYAALGLRAAYALPLSRVLFLRVELDGQTPLARADLRIDGASLWSTSPVVGRAGVGFGGVLR